MIVLYKKIANMKENGGKGVSFITLLGEALQTNILQKNAAKAKTPYSEEEAGLRR